LEVRRAQDGVVVTTPQGYFAHVAPLDDGGFGLRVGDIDRERDQGFFVQSAMTDAEFGPVSVAVAPLPSARFAGEGTGSGREFFWALNTLGWIEGIVADKPDASARDLIALLGDRPGSDWATKTIEWAEANLRDEPDMSAKDLGFWLADWVLERYERHPAIQKIVEVHAAWEPQED